MGQASPTHLPERTRRDLGRTNKRAVMGQIVLGGPVSRTAICQGTGLTAASVSRITRELIEAGLITAEPAPQETGRPGRKFVGLDVAAGGGYVLGIGLNVFQQAVTLADLKNNRLERRDLNLSDLSNPRVVIDYVIEAAREMIGQHVHHPQRLLGGGVAITGAVDPTTGLLRESPYFGWHDCNLDLGGELSAALGLPIHVENLPNALNLAEVRFGHVRAARNTLLVHCALGLGGSLYLDGQLTRGDRFAAGQIGNLPITVDEDRVATLDDLSGGRGILVAMGYAGTEPADEMASNLLAAIDLANGGDADATIIMEQAGATLGQSLAKFCGLVQPEAIVLSGPLPAAAAYLESCRAGLARYWPTESAPVTIIVSDLSNQAAARWLAIGEFLVERDLNLENLKLAGAA